MIKFNAEQIKFLRKLKGMDYKELIDTDDRLFNLTVISIEIGVQYISWDKDRIMEWYSRKNKTDDSWPAVEFLRSWIEVWLQTGEYYAGNDTRILNSIGCYYKRYVYKMKSSTKL